MSQEKFDRFAAWFSGPPRSIHPKDFLYFDGGLYAASADVDRPSDTAP